MRQPVYSLAQEHLVETKPQPDQVHRAALGKIIDYGLPALSDKRIRAIATLPGHFASIPDWESPWHYHECDLQVALVLNGSLDVAYETERISRAAKGDILFIPGTVPHDVGAASADYQVAEITFPGSFSTIESPAPGQGAVTAGRILAIRDASFEETRGALAQYRYPLDEPYSHQYAIRRYVRTRTGICEPTWRAHDDAYRVTYVTQGWKELQTRSGDSQRIGPLDIVMLPGGLETRDSEISMDYEAVEISLLRA